VRRLALCLSHQIEHNSVLGKGWRFAVLLQRSKPQVAERVEAGGVTELPSDLPGVRALLIENDLDVLNATTQLLRFWGCGVTATSRFEDAMKGMEDGLHPDAVVAD